MDSTENKPAKTVEVFGNTYPLTTPDAEVRTRVAFAVKMSTSDDVKLEAVGKMIAACLGAEAWDEILSKFLGGAGELNSLTEVVLKAIADAMETPEDSE